MQVRTPVNPVRASLSPAARLLRVTCGALAEPAGDARLGYRAHCHAAVHRGLLEEAERLRLGPPAGRLEQALRPVDGLAGLQPVLQRADLRLQALDLLEAADRHLDRRHEVGLGEGLDEVRHRAGLPSPLDELALGEGGEDDDGGDPVRGDPLGRRDAVENGLLVVVVLLFGCLLGGLPDGGLAVSGLTDDRIAVFFEHLLEGKPDQALILCDHNAARGLGHAQERTWTRYPRTYCGGRLRWSASDRTGKAECS